MHTSQQSSEVVAAAAVADSDAPEVVAASTTPDVLVFVLAVAAERMSTDRMADCTQKLQATRL